MAASTEHPVSHSTLAFGRIYADDAGESHFGALSFDMAERNFAPPAPPFWVSRTPLSYIGWGKSTQLGYGLGLALGAKLARPDKLCINIWGDAAIGFTGMDFETAVRERLPILSILFNNFSMAIELAIMPVSTEKYRSTDISGDYAEIGRAHV